METYIESETKEGVYYKVTEDSCTCPGFRHHGHCKHTKSLILERSHQDLGKLFEAIHAGVKAYDGVDFNEWSYDLELKDKILKINFKISGGGDDYDQKFWAAFKKVMAK